MDSSTKILIWFILFAIALGVLIAMINGTLKTSVIQKNIIISVMLLVLILWLLYTIM